MKSLPIILYVSYYVLTCLACSSESKSDSFKQIIDLANTYVNTYIENFPEQASLYNLKGADQSRLSDNSIQNDEKWKAFEDSIYKILIHDITKPQIGSETWSIYGILKETLESSIELRICKPELLTVNQLQGWQVFFTNIVKNQPVGTEHARSMALKRWRGIGQYVDNEIVKLKKGIELHYTVPKDIVKIVIKQLDNMLQEPYKISDFYNPALRDSSIKFRNDWLILLKDNIYPAMKKYSDFLKNNYYAKARDNISISSLPGGDKCYEAYYRFYTSLKKNSAQIKEISNYQIKLYEVKLKIQGMNLYGTDSLPLILKKMKIDSTLYFSSKDEIIAYSKELIKKIEHKCQAYFDTIPTGKLMLELVPEKQEAIQGSYFIGSLDDYNNPSVFCINASNPKKRLKSEIETIVFHETIPGHYLQNLISGTKNNNHLITKLFGINGFIEGWASYAQVLAHEMRLYSTDFSALFVLGRSAHIMRMEAGIHAENWTRSQAVKYLMNNLDLTEEISDRIVDRCIIWPGQYSTYSIGLLEMIELREQAKLSLRDKFDIKEFHSIILEDGAIPIELLREKVNWLIKKKVGENASSK